MTTNVRTTIKKIRTWTKKNQKRMRNSGMPIEMERRLKAEARRKGLTGDRFGAYVYGTMQKTTNWKPGQHRKLGQRHK